MHTLNTQEEKERARGREIMRLLDIGRGTEDGLLELALAGRERSVESVSQLYGFVLRNFGPESAITAKFWDASAAFFTTTKLTQNEIEKIRSPFPKPGEPGFRSILDEMESEGRS